MSEDGGQTPAVDQHDGAAARCECRCDGGCAYIGEGVPGSDCPECDCGTLIRYDSAAEYEYEAMWWADTSHPLR